MALLQTVQNIYYMYIWARYMNWGQKEIIRDVEIEGARVFFAWIYHSLRNRHMQHNQPLSKWHWSNCIVTNVLLLIEYWE